MDIFTMPMNQRFYKFTAIQLVIVIGIMHFKIVKLEFLL